MFLFKLNCITAVCICFADLHYSMFLFKLEIPKIGLFAIEIYITVCFYLNEELVVNTRFLGEFTLQYVSI